MGMVHISISADEKYMSHTMYILKLTKLQTYQNTNNIIVISDIKKLLITFPISFYLVMLR